MIDLILKCEIKLINNVNLQSCNRSWRSRSGTVISARSCDIATQRIRCERTFCQPYSLKVVTKCR